MTEHISRDELRRIAKPVKAKTDYKGIFLYQLGIAQIPAPLTEFVFASPRKWRFDFCWPHLCVAVEFQGGIFHGKRGHSSVTGLMRDYEKFTEASLRGWTLILITPQTIQNGKALEWVERALGLKK